VIRSQTQVQLEKYRVLLVAFLDERLSDNELETIFFPLYSGDPTAWSAEAFETLQDVFAAIDEHDPDDPSETTRIASERELRRKLGDRLSSIQDLITGDLTGS
jgi:hypothetical protein